MFAGAVKEVSSYVRPIFTIARNYGSEEVLRGAAPIFFVNDEGWAVTSKQLARAVVDAGKFEQKYSEFRRKRSKILEGGGSASQLAALEESNRYREGELCQLKVNFIDCIDRMDRIDCKLHPQYDVALIHFSGYEKLGYTGHAVFALTDEALKPGKFLCRIGYPFPEFTNYKYDAERDDIVWATGKSQTPRFPVEGMVTRMIAGSENLIIGVEMSTAGFRGLAGGPLFDEQGLIYGMHCGKSPLNLGQCLHMDVIKAFLIKEGVRYYEAEKGGGPQIQGGGRPNSGMGRAADGLSDVSIISGTGQLN